MAIKSFMDFVSVGLSFLNVQEVLGDTFPAKNTSIVGIQYGDIHFAHERDISFVIPFLGLHNSREKLFVSYYKTAVSKCRL